MNEWPTEEPPSADEICNAMLQMLGTLQLIDGLEKVVNDRGGHEKCKCGEPITFDKSGRLVRFPFQSNVRRALELFDTPRIRSELVRRLYAEELGEAK